MPYLPDAAEGSPSRISGWITRAGNAKWIRDCRTYYRMALLSVSIIVFLNAWILIISILKFEVFDVIGFSFSTLISGAMAAAIHYLMKYSNLPDSDHWLTDAQTHIMASSFISFIMISYDSAPWSRHLKSCLSSNTKGFLAHTKCILATIINYLAWLAPLAMFIAACVVYLNATAVVRRVNEGRAWRRVNVADGNENEPGQLSLPYDSLGPLLSSVPGPYDV